MFKLLSGSYSQVINYLFSHDTLEAPEVDHSSKIRLDLNRTCYLWHDPRTSIASIKQRLLSEFSYPADETRPQKLNSFHQGDFSGGLVRRYLAKLMFIDYQGGVYTGPTVDDIQVCYLNTHNELCGLSIALMPDERSKENYRCAIAIVKRVTDVPQNREVTYITAPQLLEPSIYPFSKNLLFQEMLQYLKEKMDLPLLYESLVPILQKDGLASKRAFDTLKSCFAVNANAKQQLTWLQAHKELSRNRKLLLAISVCILGIIASITSMILGSPAFGALLVLFAIGLYVSTKAILKNDNPIQSSYSIFTPANRCNNTEQQVPHANHI
jgi:hypothetical protein